MSESEKSQPSRSSARMRKRSRQGFFQALKKSSDQSAFPEPELGRRLRELRCERGLTLRMLAELSGLNINTLSMIENSRTSPSVATITQLAASLQLPMTAFFENNQPRTSIVFQHADHRPKLSFSNGMLEELSRGFSARGAQPFLVHIHPGAASGLRPIVHTGLEFVYCLEGSLEYQVGESSFELLPGDSLFFEAHLPHLWQNSSSKVTRVILVLCLLSDNDHPAREHFSSALQD